MLYEFSLYKFQSMASTNYWSRITLTYYGLSSSNSLAIEIRKNRTTSIKQKSGTGASARLSAANHFEFGSWIAHFRVYRSQKFYVFLTIANFSFQISSAAVQSLACFMGDYFDWRAISHHGTKSKCCGQRCRIFDKVFDQNKLFKCFLITVLWAKNQRLEFFRHSKKFLKCETNQNFNFAFVQKSFSFRF